MIQENNFKSTNSRWFTEIPENWHLSKLKFLVNIFTGNSLNDMEKALYSSDDNEKVEGNIYISSKDINVNNNVCNYDTGTVIPYKETKYKVAPKDSSLLCIEGGSAGRKITFTLENVCFVNKLACFQSDEATDSKFIFYYLQSNEFKSQFQNSLSGLIGGVSLTNLKDFEIAVPSLNNQTKIASYLDKKTTQIDAIIDKKQKLLNLLDEKKKAVINEAVTKGLNPNVPMKDSGIEWIGEIPEDWKISKLKYLTALNSNNPIENSLFKLSLDNIESYTGKLKSQESSSFEGIGNYYKPYDVLFNKLRPYLSKVYLADHFGCCVGELLVLTPNKFVVPEFLFYRLLSSNFIKEVDSSTYGAKMPRASWSFIGDLQIPIPAIEVQISVSKYLKGRISLIDELIDKISSQIIKIKEYRQSIISEAVTGKNDVSNYN